MKNFLQLWLFLSLFFVSVGAQTKDFTRWVNPFIGTTNGGNVLLAANVDDATDNDTAGALQRRISGGEAFDVVISSPASLQALIYGGLDAATDGPSWDRLGEGYFLTRSKCQWFMDHYLRSPDDARHPHAVPLAAADLAGMPPALVITALDREERCPVDWNSASARAVCRIHPMLYPVFNALPPLRTHVLCWLVKTEPEDFSWDDQVKKGAKGEVWFMWGRLARGSGTCQVCNHILYKT